MKKLCVALGGLILGGCVVVVDEQGGAVGVGVPAPTVVVVAPKLQPVAGLQGVMYAPGNPNILFYNGRYWRYHNGRWQFATRYGHWVHASAAIVPRIFLTIPSWHVAHRRLVVHHPHFRKPTVIVKPKVTTPLVKPRVRGAVGKPAKPLRPPVVRPGRPAVVRPGKPAKPAKPAKPKPEKEKEKEKEKQKGKAKGIRR